MRRLAAAVPLILWLGACLGDPVGPLGLLTVQVVGLDSLQGAPGRPLPQLAVRVVDGAGRSLAGASVAWSVVAGGGRVDSSGDVTDAAGVVRAQWVLGTKAGDPQRLQARVRVAGHTGEAAFSAIAVPIEVNSVEFLAETTEVRLGVPALVRAEAIDPFGNHFAPPVMRFRALDSAVAVVDSGGVIRSRRRGYGRIEANAQGHGDTARVHVIQIVQSIVVPDTLTFHSIGQSKTLDVRLLDDQGATVLDSLPDVGIDDSGVVRLAAPASVQFESRANGVATIHLHAGSTGRTVSALVDQLVATVKLPVDSLHFDALGDTSRLIPDARDSLHVPVVNPRLSYFSNDTTVAHVDTAGVVTARSNGTAAVAVRSTSGVVSSVPVGVRQETAAITVAQDTLGFDALGAMRTLGAVARDRFGSPVADATLTYQVGDTTIASVDTTGRVRARANGLTTVTASQGGHQASSLVRVAQVAVRLTAGIVSGQPIVSLASGAPLSLSCQAYDRNDFPVAQDPVVSAGRVGPPGTCSHFDVTRSGRDTLSVALGSASARVPVTVALLPGISAFEGDSLVTDSIPTGDFPTVVSARRNSRGQMELYVAMQVDTLLETYEDLHRYVSDDEGATFRYDGVVLRHDTTGCSPLGFGVEHVAIVPRADAPGWRMFFAGGQFYCYGWQVFSAVSSDERNWAIEPGVRLSNTLDGEPSEVGPIPWPVGEGLVAHQLPDGTWRLIVGGMEHIDPWEDKFQIVEWRSGDQLTWTYLDALLTTRQLPPQGQASVYSPTISEFAPGLFRMIFVADDRNDPDGRFRLWSAVSTDERTWQLEGPLVQSTRYNYYYGSLVGDLLVMIRAGDTGTRHLAATRVQMP